MGGLTSIYESARRTLLGNLRRGREHQANGLDEFCYVCPSPTIYPHQWLWDSCFHAIVMARFQPELAKAELRTIASKINAEGFISHLINWRQPSRIPCLEAVAAWLHRQSHLAHLTQPPVLAIAVEEVYRLSGDQSFVAELLPAVKRHYDYLATHRDPDGDGLVSIIFPIESGMDHLPTYDEVLGIKKASAVKYHLANLDLAVRYLMLGWSLDRIFAADRFSVEDVGFNSIYAHGLRAVARLATVGGDQEALKFEGMAERVERALIERCYDEKRGAFYSLYSSEDRPLRVMTVASLLPLLLSDLPGEVTDRLVSEQLLNRDAFWTAYPVPSVSLAESSFDPGSSPIPLSTNLVGVVKRQLDRHHLIWRGPTWINTNWLLSRGLRQHGYGEVADDLTRKTAEMVSRQGFWEYYQPETGAGLGAGDFGWSTLVVDMLANAADPRLATEYGELEEVAASALVKGESHPEPAVSV